MKKINYCLFTGLFLSISPLHAASFLEKLGLGKSSTNSTSALTTVLSQDEISAGLKEALAKGVERAVALLGKDDGFLNDLSVKIPIPQNLQRVERTLRTLGQDQLADEFVTTMDRAAEKAVPEAAKVLAGAIKQMALAGHSFHDANKNTMPPYYTYSFQYNFSTGSYTYYKNGLSYFFSILPYMQWRS